MRKWIGVFFNPTSGESGLSLTPNILPALDIIRAAKDSGIPVKLITAINIDHDQVARLQQWFSAQQIEGITFTSTIDSECVLIIGSDVYRSEPGSDRLCQSCRLPLGDRLAELGVRSWPPRGGGFVEFT